MDKIKIAITGRVASVVALPEVVADNAEYEVDFALDPREGWDMSLPITALFVRRDGSYTPRIMDAGKTSCTMPPQTGTNIVFVGLTQDDMRTTTPATIKVHRSIRTVAHDPLPAPSEDVYAQILAAYAGIKTISGKGAPTSATQGKVNQLYRDEDTQKLYICTATDGGYTWAAVSGGSVDVDATLTKAGYAADAKAAGDAIRDKLDKTELPTAVNDALAQAKASGEFDGAKGETGPAGAKGDTGPAGPKGADGKDGAGMDVTGAKVGQIAKITAVDSAGKPTEWEPVDMPGGGTYTLPIASPTVLGGVKPTTKTDAMTQSVGVDDAGALWTAPYIEGYELVFTETIAEDVASYTRTTDKDGNTFDLTDILVIIFTKPFAESTNQLGRALGFLPITSWGPYALCGISESIKSGGTDVGRYDVVYAKVIDGYQVCTRYYKSQNTTNVFGVMQEVTSAGATGIKFHTDATKLMQIDRPEGNFTCLKIVGYSNPLIAAGTIINLYKRKGS